MVGKKQCIHTCGCTYSANKSSDVNVHQKAVSKHRACQTGCPGHGLLERRLRVVYQTPESYQERLEQPPKKRARTTTPSTSASGSITPSVSPTPPPSSTPSSTVPTPAPPSPPPLPPPHLHVLCVFDPSREKAPKEVKNGEVDWVERTVDNEEARSLLSNPAFEKFVHRVRKTKKGAVVRMFEWVGSWSVLLDVTYSQF